jgi:sigma-E factor negative regulatory protein RseA
MMKHEISALMDGEVFEDEAGVLLDQIKRDPRAQRDWDMYHLIGDVLRQPEYIHRDIGERVRTVLQTEPTVLAPRRLKQKARMYALSAAASVLAFGVVAWMSLQISPEHAPQMQAGNMRPVNMQIQPKSNDYLMAHQEFSPSNDMNGGVSYIRTVTFSPEEKSQ